MERLTPFFPAIIVFAGAFIVAVGGFWAAYRQSNFNAEIRTKNEEIIRLQRDALNSVTGGDGFASIGFQIYRPDGTLFGGNAPPDELLLVPIIVSESTYPLYEVTVRFADVMHAFNINDSMRTFPIGNLPRGPGVATISQIRLRQHGANIGFNIFYSARNGLWQQELRMRWTGKGWETANRISRGRDILKEEITPNFPRKDDGSVDWDGGKETPPKP